MSFNNSCVMRLGVLVLLSSALGCGDDAPAAADAGPETGAIRAQLQALGIELVGEDRLDEAGNPLPADFVPLGTRLELGGVEEFLLIGASPTAADGAALNGQVSFLNGLRDGSSLIHLADSLAPTPWSDDSSNIPTDFHQGARAAVSADVDGDGLNESVVVYAAASLAGEIYVDVMEDSEDDTPFARSSTLLLSLPDVRAVSLSEADLDGDGIDDLVLGLSTSTESKLVFVLSDGANLVVDESATQTLAATLSGAAQSLRIASGNLDRDASDEIVVVQNERDPISDNRSASYLILDDAKTMHTVLLSGDIAAGNRTAEVADVAISDLDEDGVDEVVLGGIQNVDDGCAGLTYVGLVLDDGTQGFAETASRQFLKTLDCSGLVASLQVNEVFVETLDLNQDGVPEIAINQSILKSSLADYLEIPASEFAMGPQFDRSTAQMVSGDFTGDGLADIAIYSQDSSHIAIYGLRPIDSSFRLLKTIDVDTSSWTGAGNVLLISANIDNDRVVMRPVFSGTGATRRGGQLVYSSPTVMAVVAAAPCEEGIGQNLEACSTSWGSSVTDTLTTETSFSVTATLAVGVEADVHGVGLEYSKAVSKGFSKSSGLSESLTKSVSFSTAPFEDSVIFAAQPVDLYRYEIVASPLAGQGFRSVELTAPRLPQVQIAELKFFNSVVDGERWRIPDEVLTHTIGDTSSYPGEGDKDQIANETDVIEVGPQPVGQGGGATELGLAVGSDESRGLGTSFALDFELRIKAVLFVGFGVSIDRERSMTMSWGKETSYTGSVGSIDAEHFADEQYQFGMFTYLYKATGGRIFEVVNYWVDQ